MPRTISLLDRVRIASPCDMPWEAMQGDDRTRHCDKCNLNVYNLADMPRGEAERLVEEHEGKMCARMYVREDGTYLGNDCPVGLRLARRAVAKLVGVSGAILIAVMQFASSALSIRPDTDWVRWQRPFDTWANRINPGPMPGGLVLGTPAPLPRFQQFQQPPLPQPPSHSAGATP